MSNVISGYVDDPTKAYLVANGFRHWITNPAILEQCAVSFVGKARSLEPEGRPVMAARDFAAIKHLQGDGIEIGALHCPSVLPPSARARYVDYISAQEARSRYPDLTIAGDVVVDDGEDLAKFAESSLDFIVANHFLEHTRNPLGVIRTHLRKLKPGGKLLYALPDKRHSFDHARPITSFQHLVADDQHGWDLSDRAHYLEYVRYVDKLTDPKAIEAHACVLKNMDNRIHFHVWDADAIREMFSAAVAYLDYGFIVADVFEADHEVVTVLCKC